MIDVKEATNRLAQGPAIEAALTSLADALGGAGIAMLPEHFRMHDLESLMPTRRRMRGSMHTARLDSFVAYARNHVEEDGSSVFVNPDDMTAVAVLNLGDKSTPGHADHTARLELQKTAPYRAMQRALASALSQRELAEFMEDWAPHIACFHPDGTELPTSKAIDAVRRITIEAARNVESETTALSEQRSVMERVAATSKAGGLPSFVRFACVPYQGLSERTFSARLSIRTGDAQKPALSLALHLVRGELHAEEMAAELAVSVAAELQSALPVFVGAFKRG